MSNKAVGESEAAGGRYKYDLSYMGAGPIRCSKCGTVESGAGLSSKVMARGAVAEITDETSPK